MLQVFSVLPKMFENDAFEQVRFDAVLYCFSLFFTVFQTCFVLFCTCCVLSFVLKIAIINNDGFERRGGSHRRSASGTIPTRG